MQIPNMHLADMQLIAYGIGATLLLRVLWCYIMATGTDTRRFDV